MKQFKVSADLEYITVDDAIAYKVMTLDYQEYEKFKLLSTKEQEAWLLEFGEDVIYEFDAIERGELGAIEIEEIDPTSDKVRYILIEVEEATSRFWGCTKDLPGCVSYGNTLKELKTNMQEAVNLHLEGMKEDGIKLPTNIELVYEEDFGITI